MAVKISDVRHYRAHVFTDHRLYRITRSQSQSESQALSQSHYQSQPRSVTASDTHSPSHSPDPGPVRAPIIVPVLDPVTVTVPVQIPVPISLRPSPAILSYKLHWIGRLSRSQRRSRRRKNRREGGVACQRGDIHLPRSFFVNCSSVCHPHCNLSPEECFWGSAANIFGKTVSRKFFFSF